MRTVDNAPVPDGTGALLCRKVGEGKSPGVMAGEGKKICIKKKKDH